MNFPMSFLKDDHRSGGRCSLLGTSWVWGLNVGLAPLWRWGRPQNGTVQKFKTPCSHQNDKLGYTLWTNHGEVTNPNVGPGTLWFVKAWRKPLLMANGFQQPQRISWAWLLPPLKLRILGLGQGVWIVSYCIPIFGTAGSMPLETCLKQRPKFCLFGNVVQTC